MGAGARFKRCRFAALTPFSQPVMISLSISQVRLLLSKPQRRYSLGKNIALVQWDCGCFAKRGSKRFAVTPCRYHKPLLQLIPPKDDEDDYQRSGGAFARRYSPD